MRKRSRTSLAAYFGACGAFSLWLALLFAGFAGGGAVHLLLLAALLLFPWRDAQL